MKENQVQQKFHGKIVTPQEMTNLLKKNKQNKIWILKQLSQLGIDVSSLADEPLNQLYLNCEKLIKSTYSIKYLGMNKNEMGVISRRVDPEKGAKFSFNQVSQTQYVVNKFFFPKPLNVGHKRPKAQTLNFQNLETQIKKAIDLHNNKLPLSSKRTKISLYQINKQKRQKSKYKEKQNDYQKMKKLHSHLKNNRNSQIIDLSSIQPQTVNLNQSYSRFLINGMLLVKKMA